MDDGPVRAFGALMDDPHLRVAFASCNSMADRMAIVAMVRKNAAGRLHAAVQRVPTVSGCMADAYLAKGLPVPAWNLDDNDDVVVFCLTLGHHAPTADERRAAALLRACVLAAEAGDVLPYAAMAHGVKFHPGRKPGSVGTVRAWVKKYMRKHPDAMPAQAWDALKERPPRGCTVYENRLGKYIETEGAPDTGRVWFGTIVGQERPKRP